MIDLASKEFRIRNSFNKFFITAVDISISYSIKLIPNASPKKKVSKSYTISSQKENSEGRKSDTATQCNL